LLLVKAYTYSQQLEKCLPVLQGAVSLDPFNPALHFELGRSYMLLERWDESRAAFDKSLELEPAQPNSRPFRSIRKTTSCPGFSQGSCTSLAWSKKPTTSVTGSWH
jgi:tetratricopeptide (TPR) repeat protein